MIIKYIKREDIKEKMIEDINAINNTCLSDETYDELMYDFVAESIGKYLLFDEDKIVGRVSIHQRDSMYEGMTYTLGGFGGLAVLSEYRNRGYGRQLVNMALNKLDELGCDIAVMCVDRKKNTYKMYMDAGFVFLDRPAYFINALGNEKSNDSVMIRAVRNTELFHKILNNEGKFHYGIEKGYW